MFRGDTIAAIATPAGIGGIAVIRVSGPGARDVAERVFVPARASSDSGDASGLCPAKGWVSKYGHVYDGSGDLIDEAIMSWMPGPSSYTREDVAEISCHGGTAVARAVLQAVLEAGARIAQPGEFTRRAFLNGRISLEQAEAVLSMINARTERARRAASSFLGGRLGAKVRKAQETIVSLMTLIEASLDFPEEDIPDVALKELADESVRIASLLEEAWRDASRGRILWEGVSVAIVGRPNVGKSRLLNALLGEERAIVSESPGTTRDVVSEVANIRGIPIRLIDTAGMRDSADPVERIGVERARTALKDADVALAVVDGSVPFDRADMEIAAQTPGKHAIIVINKCDLPEELGREDAQRIAAGRLCLKVSALTGEGLDRLEEAIETLVLGDGGRGSNSMGPLPAAGEGGTWINGGHSEIGMGLGREGSELLGMRREDCLRRAASSLRDVARGVEEGMPPDMVSIDLRAAMDTLGELTGETTREDIVDRVFAQFCVGK
ncbi:MAG: tRNA uridine-5-carboxymethylaminomethyl(34) synthesis GTPase MnmE [Firmicutes bacterium]|nr:tRNA uridine-5-carboxymethylaminomethyl(34) synthesis GTPase MnmE [Bacillota bacterium]MDD4335925.1 tRNA uridine-5-carboxymethylaminomethyl(34) synthesis GTPase MnmE [Bacillota bacterium]MDD4791841.1 tRNA uridine-5-carboxymethylaminomethyl(34) synthesis GTPase MnmE [Bacillota bacterium]